MDANTREFIFVDSRSFAVSVFLFRAEGILANPTTARFATVYR